MKTFTILLLFCLLISGCKSENNGEDPAMRDITSMELSKLMGIGWNLEIGRAHV